MAFFDGAGGALIGGGLSAIGSLIGAQDANRNYDDQVEEQITRGQTAQFLNLANLYGPEFANIMKHLPRAMMLAGSGNPTDLLNIYKDPAFQEVMSGNSTKGSIGQLRQVGEQFIKEGDKQLGRYDRETAGIQQQGAGLSSLISNWGKGQAATINQGYDKSLRQTNDETMARYNASGLGASTAMNSALAGNRRENQFARQGSLQALANGQIDRQTQQGNANLASMAQRSAGQNTLWGTLQDRNLGLKLQPITAGMAGMQQVGSIWGGMPTISGGGLSPGGSALSNIGNALAQYGTLGLIAGQNAARSADGGFSARNGGTGQRSYYDQPAGPYGF